MDRIVVGVDPAGFQYLIGPIKTSLDVPYDPPDDGFQYLIGPIKTVGSMPSVRRPASFQYLIGPIKTSRSLMKRKAS